MKDSSASPRSCPECGAALPVEATEGLCPRCLMARVMQPSRAATGGMPQERSTSPANAPHEASHRPASPAPPQPEELAALLPTESYRVERLLGRGGMGAVYKGVQVRLQRPVAIKILRRDQRRDHDFEQRFQREALAMAKLNHPNIVGVIDYGEASPEYLYIVMELVEGADLMDVIRTGRMTQEMALQLVPQICDALQFAHDHGIIHRDIKPSNIMLTRDGRIKIADFGLAKRFDAESRFHTLSGTGMGTPDYAAPEQLTADARIDHRADIYALGVMIYQMITGQLPRGVWKPPSQHTACDPQWDDIVSHAMQADPKDRYQAASEIKTDVSQIAPRKSASSEKSADTAVLTPVKSRAPLVLGVLASIIVLAAGAFFATHPDGGFVRQDATGPAPEQAPAGADKTSKVQTFAGHRYQFVSGAFNWNEAKQKAESMGGHLATVTSKEENEWIYASFGPKLDPNLRASSVWIGGTAEASGQPWKWITEEPFAFADWIEGEPDYSSTTGQPVPGSFGIAIKRHERLSWFDDPVKRSNVNAGFIIEWEDNGAGKPALNPPASVDLLALADVAADAEGGIWHREGTDLIVAEDPTAEWKNPGKHKGVRFGFALPVRVRGSYRLEVEFTKHGPKGTVSLLLPLPAARSVVAHFQESQPYAGLVAVRGFNTREPENPTRTPNRLEDGQRYRATVSVLLKGDQVEVAATLDDKPLFGFQGPVADLDSRMSAWADQERPGMRSIDPVTWHSFRIKPLDGGTITPVRAGVALPVAAGATGGALK